jgi:site-specific recombinase XerD
MISTAKAKDNEMSMNFNYPDIKTFSNYLTTQDLAPVSVQGYCADLRRFARWVEYHQETRFALDTLQVRTIQSYRHYLLEQGRKPNTINRDLAAISAFGNWGVQAGRIPQNPALHIRSLDSVSLAPKWLDKNQRAALLRAAKDDLALAQKRYPRLWLLRLRDTVLVIVLLYTGLRVHEVCQLRVDDVEISSRKGQVTVTGKGFKQRTIPLSKPAREALAEWLKVRPPANQEALFTNQRGGALQPRSVQRAIHRLAENAGLDATVTPHILRHTFAKSLIDKGVSLEKVAKLLGHSNLNTTRIYTTPSEQDLEEAVGKLM